MKIRERELNRIIKEHYYMKIVIIEFSESIFGEIIFMKTICKYNHKNGFLYFKDLINNIKINIISQYSIQFDENRKIIEIRLDNGMILKIKTIKWKKHFVRLFFIIKYYRIVLTFHLKVERSDTGDKSRIDFAISWNAFTTKRRNYESKIPKQRRLSYTNT